MIGFRLSSSQNHEECTTDFQTMTINSRLPFPNPFRSLIYLIQKSAQCSCSWNICSNCFSNCMEAFPSYKKFRRAMDVIKNCTHKNSRARL